MPKKLAEPQLDQGQTDEKKSNLPSNEKLKYIRLSKILPNPFQPRIEMNPEETEELAASIRKDGLLQPVVLTRAQSDGTHYLIAGHRRVEAYRYLENNQIKAIIKPDVSLEQLRLFGLIENIQRKNLNMIEEANAYKYMLDSQMFKSQLELSKAVSKREDYISRYLKILLLSDKIIQDLRENQSTKDMKVLAALNRVTDVPLQEKIYFDFIGKKISREKALELVKKFLGKISDTQGPIIKFTRNRLSFMLDLPAMDKNSFEKMRARAKDKVKRIESILNEIYEMGIDGKKNDGTKKEKTVKRAGEKAGKKTSKKSEKSRSKKLPGKKN